MTRHLSSVGLVCASVLVASCSSMDQRVDKNYEANKKKVEASANEVITKNVTSNVRAVQRTKKSYLGFHAVALSNDMTMPQIVRQQVTFKFPGKYNIATIAERITKVTGIPVSVKPDVYMPSSAFVTAGAAAATSAPAPGGASATSGMPQIPIPMSGLNDGVSRTTAQSSDHEFEMNYEGPLSGYLDLLASRTGISWEYRDGVISFRRLVTRIFTLKAIPGSSKFDSAIGKTSNTKSGSNTSSSGFATSSNIEMKSSFGVWDSLAEAIKSMLSPSGKMAMSQATGNITVTDSKDIVDEVGHLIDKENAIMTRQVAMRVEVLSVRLNNGNDYGVDWSAVYTQLSKNYQLRFASPTSIVGSQAGSTAVSILAPVNGQGSALQNRLSGTQAIFNALHTYGRVSVVTTANALTLNRQPVPVAITNSVGYVEETIPATGGVAGGGGAPGLKTNTITTGFLLNLLPTVLDSNSILLQFSVGISDLTRLPTFTSGSGANQQSVQTPEVASTEFLQKVAIRPGETLVLSGYERVIGQYDRRTLAENAPVGLGGSFTGMSNREAVVILVTPVLSEGAI